MYIFCLACPKLFWTVHDETQYKGLSSNEFLRRRIRKKVLFFSFRFFFNLIVLLIFSNVLSLSHPLFEWVYWHLEGPPNYTGEICGLFRLSFLAENYSTVLNKVGTFNVK